MRHSTIVFSAALLSALACSKSASEPQLVYFDAGPSFVDGGPVGESDAGVDAGPCPGETMCAGGCVDTGSDPANCGGCGLACSTGTLCQAGSCGCPGGETLCGAFCVDTTIDTGNCGGCGTSCVSGASCNDGGCACPANASTTCDGECVDIQTSPNDCGGCGTRCPAGSSCVDAGCACPSPNNAICSNVCTDNETDPNNCGSCGAICTGTCAGGVCIAVLGSGYRHAAGITVDAQNVYWAAEGNQTSVGGGVFYAALDGGGVTTVYSAQVNEGPWGIAVDSTNVYWTDSADGTLNMSPIASPSPSKLLSGLSDPGELRISAGILYYSRVWRRKGPRLRYRHEQ